jgi:hypothetical protein
MLKLEIDGFLCSLLQALTNLHSPSISPLLSPSLQAQANIDERMRRMEEEELIYSLHSFLLNPKPR